MKPKKNRKYTPEQALRHTCEEGMGEDLSYDQIRHRLDTAGIARAGQARKARAKSANSPAVQSPRRAVAAVLLVVAVLILTPAAAVGGFLIARSTLDPRPPEETADSLPPMGITPSPGWNPDSTLEGEATPVTPRPITPGTSGEAWNNVFNLSESYTTDNALFLRAEHLDPAITEGALPAVLTINGLSEWERFFSDATLGITAEMQAALGELTEDFVNHSLLVIITEGRSGSIRYSLEEIYNTNGKINRSWELVAQVPLALTMDIVHWCVVVPVSKAEAQMPVTLTQRDIYEVDGGDLPIMPSYPDIQIAAPYQLWFESESYGRNGCLYGRLGNYGDWSYPHTKTVTTLAEWQSLYLGCAANSVSDSGFSEGLAALDEAFFAEQSLRILYVEEGSGSYRHRVDEVLAEDGTLWVTLTTLYPAVGTWDMAYWAILIPIDKGSASLPVEIIRQQSLDFPRLTLSTGYLYGGNDYVYSRVGNGAELEWYSFPYGCVLDSVTDLEEALWVADDPKMPAAYLEAMRGFDEDFFAESSLLLLCLKEEAGRAFHDVSKLAVRNDQLSVSVNTRYFDQTQDFPEGAIPHSKGYCVILIPVDKEAAGLPVSIEILE